MNYRDIIITVSKELNIPKEVVNRAYKSYWEFIRSTIKSLPLKDDLEEKEFEELRTNFNIPSLGKLVCTYDKFLKLKRKFNYAKNQ